MIAIDPDGRCHKLGSAAAEARDGLMLKRLDYMNRDVSRIILIDDNPEAFQLFPRNTLQVKPFTDVADSTDRVLYDLVPLLQVRCSGVCGHARIVLHASSACVVIARPDFNLVASCAAHSSPLLIVRALPTPFVVRPLLFTHSGQAFVHDDAKDFRDTIDDLGTHEAEEAGTVYGGGRSTIAPPRLPCPAHSPAHASSASSFSHTPIHSLTHTSTLIFFVWGSDRVPDAYQREKRRRDAQTQPGPGGAAAGTDPSEIWPARGGGHDRGARGTGHQPGVHRRGVRRKRRGGAAAAAPAVVEARAEGVRGHHTGTGDGPRRVAGAPYLPPYLLTPYLAPYLLPI